MKGSISKDGFLNIFRGKENKIQDCPYNNASEICGDWCALFGEPEEVELFREKKTAIKLRLCTHAIYFDSFIDKRILTNG